MMLSRHQKTSVALSALALVCWTVMYMAWHDIWHALGRPDLTSAPAVHVADVRAFLIAYAVLPILIAVQIIVTITRGPSTAGSQASATANT